MKDDRSMDEMSESVDPEKKSGSRMSIFNDLKKLNRLYVFLVIFSIFSDETTWVFLGIANKLFTSRYGVTKYQVS